MPRIHFRSNPPQFTCPGCAWALRDCTPDQLQGKAPLACGVCGWAPGITENLTASPAQELTAAGRVDLGESVFTDVPEKAGAAAPHAPSPSPFKAAAPDADRE